MEGLDRQGVKITPLHAWGAEAAEATPKHEYKHEYEWMNGEVSHDPEHRNGEPQQPSRDVVAFYSLSQFE